MKHIRILLIEDNRILREGIAAIINAEPDMRVIAATAALSPTLRIAKEATPHILLIDLGLRNQDGVRAVKSVIKEFPKIHAIGMGLIPTQVDIVEFVQAGASGFILKDATKQDFLETIRLVAKGTKFVPPSLTDSLFSLVINHAVQGGKAKPLSSVRMTNREREVIALISDGRSNKDIALRLKIKLYTVKSHVHNILEKLALHSRLQISAYIRKEQSR